MSLPLIQQKQKTCLAGYQQLTKWYDLCHNNVCIVDWTTDTTDKERRWLNRQINAYLYICIYIYIWLNIYIYIAKDIRTNLTMNISTSFFCLPIFHKKAFPRHFRRSLQDRKLRHDNIVSKAWSAACFFGIIMRIQAMIRLQRLDKGGKARPTRPEQKHGWRLVVCLFFFLWRRHFCLVPDSLRIKFHVFPYYMLPCVTAGDHNPT